jgi:putative DNA methylase
MSAASYPVIAPKKLIEVALPLDAINEEGSKRKRKAPKGYPTTLHKWWAPRPIAAARAVLFAQLVNDPSWRWEIEHPGETPPNHLKASWAKTRRRLFQLIEELITWENSRNEAVLARARAEIWKSWRDTCEVNGDHPHAHDLFNPERLPPFHDPFAGGGSIPLEAQRLGLQTFASDLNPVAVLINKAMIEAPALFAGHRPVHPSAHVPKALLDRSWRASEGLAEDIRYYGAQVNEAAYRKVGQLYSALRVTEEMARTRPDLKRYVGQDLTPVAYLWARTVLSPNPAYADVQVPLVATYMLSSKDGKEVYVEPVIDGRAYSFTVRVGKPANATKVKAGTKLSGVNFECILSSAPISGDYIKSEGRAGKLGMRLLAIVAEGKRERVYLDPSPEIEALALAVNPDWRPQGELPTRLTGGSCVPYGLTKWADLFTNRQLAAAIAFAEAMEEVRQRVHADALRGAVRTSTLTVDAEEYARKYADAVALYLALALGRMVDYGSTICTWRAKDNAMRSSLAMQAIPMTWDFAEGSPFGGSSSGFEECVGVVATVVEMALPQGEGTVCQAAAQNVSLGGGRPTVVSTDPPYYNNIAYADLSDFFYPWLRRSLRHVVPDLFTTLATPKAEELVATPHRHGGVEQAEAFFLNGMTAVMQNVVSQGHPAFPCTIYYAFKQSETSADDGTTSTGWETFLDAVVRSGFSIGGTWPMRTEGDNRQVGIGANALASSVVLVCRPRSTDARTISRRQFTAELRAVLPAALEAMTRGAEDVRPPVAPVDLSQAIIGPGMEVFSKYAAVLEADGSAMSVRTALALINRYLADDEFDSDTQFCLAWFEQHGWDAGQFGSADTLARAKGTSVEGVRSAGVVRAGGGDVRLTRWSEYPADWDPTTDPRLPVWEVLHHLIRSLRADGEAAAARVFVGAQGKVEAARQLAYRLYTLCERTGRAEDARAYNELIASWSGIESVVAQGVVIHEQSSLFDS